jgi:hypothetical protein
MKAEVNLLCSLCMLWIIDRVLDACTLVSHWECCHGRQEPLDDIETCHQQEVVAGSVSDVLYSCWLVAIRAYMLQQYPERLCPTWKHVPRGRRSLLFLQLSRQKLRSQ